MATNSARPRITVLYHYLHPDDVVSARHFDDFCLELHARGWEVEALPCNRGCRDESKTYSRAEDWQGIRIRRVWRPALKQNSTLGRIGNALWMLAAWSVLALRGRKRVPDVVVMGTDPILSVAVAIPLRILRPRIKIVHWCYDLYPEAAEADGILNTGGWTAHLARTILRRAYRRCDLVADLGNCMRSRLDNYGHQSAKATLVPWALHEPAAVSEPDPKARQELFGDCRLGVLYSGNFGRAHSGDEFLALARQLRGVGIQFCFSVRGNRADELHAAVTADDRNISFAGFASEEALALRLTAADIHLVSLRPQWTGVVVPSKFFGCLAAGRPVLFAGGRDSCIAQWIVEHRVGWILDAQALLEVAKQLLALAENPGSLQEMRAHCHNVYRDHFSKTVMMDCWHAELQKLVRPTALPDSRWG